MDLLMVILLMAFGAGFKDAYDKEKAKKEVVVEQPTQEVTEGN